MRPMHFWNRSVLRASWVCALLCTWLAFGNVAVAQVAQPAATTVSPANAPLNVPATAAGHTPGNAGGSGAPAGGAATITFSPTTYTAGTPVAVTVRVTDAVNRQFGFQATARLESNLSTAQAGRFSTGTGVGVLCDNGAPRTSSGNCPSSAPVEFIGHTTPSSTGTWTASTSACTAGASVPYRPPRWASTAWWPRCCPPTRWPRCVVSRATVARSR